MSKPHGHTVNGAQHVVTAHQDAFNQNCSHNANGMASGIPFTYDPIGNRVSASETIGGEMLLKSYTANELNQYTTIANSAAVGLRGDATNSAVVTINGESVQSDNIASDTVPWHFALEADNASGSNFPFAEIVAVVNPPGTNTPDIVSTSRGHLYAPPQTETLTYDADGNLLSDGRWHYTWNGENRLIKAEELLSPTNRQPYTVKYAYDHRGRMVWKQLSTNAVVASTRTLHWDDYNIIAETVAQDTATNVTYNIWGLDLSGTLQGAGGVGGLLSVVRDDETSFLTYDANGNITEYLSADGTIAAHYEYSPFGEIIVQSGDLADSFTHRFSTKSWCPVTGLSEYQYRKYSPLLGRWLSRDPIAGEGFRTMHQDLVRRIMLVKDEAVRAADPEPEGSIRIIQDEQDEIDVLGLTWINLYLALGNSPINVIDDYGLKCNIAIAMSHASFIDKIISNGNPDKCDRFGAVSCFIDLKMKEAKDKWGDILIPGWPSHPGLLYCSDLPSIFNKAGPATKSEAKAMCDSPCCCESVVLTFVCDLSMYNCLEKLKSKGKISRNYCGTSNTYSCP